MLTLQKHLHASDHYSGLYFLREARIASGGALRITEHLFGSDGEECARLERADATIETSEPDLGALQVEENSNVRASIVGGNARRGDPGCMRSVISVRSVQPKYVHAFG